MNKQEKNKLFYRNYVKEFSGKKKTREKMEKYIEDKKLIEHGLFFEKLFPEYEWFIDELFAEGDRIFVRVHFKGLHKGKEDGIPATLKSVEAPFALGYKIKNEKIVDFWAIGNELELFEQLGLSKEQIEVPKQ